MHRARAREPERESSRSCRSPDWSSPSLPLGDGDQSLVRIDDEILAIRSICLVPNESTVLGALRIHSRQPFGLAIRLPVPLAQLAIDFVADIASIGPSGFPKCQDPTRRPSFQMTTASECVVSAAAISRFKAAGSMPLDDCVSAAVGASAAANKNPDHATEGRMSGGGRSALAPAAASVSYAGLVQ